MTGSAWFRSRRLILVLAVMSLVAAACGNGDEEAEEPAEAAPAEAELPGPPSGDIPGALPPEEIPPVTYNSETGMLEKGDPPAGEFDPAIREADREWVIGYSHGWAAIDFDVKLTEGVETAAEASGVRLVGRCDMEFKAEKAITCAEETLGLNPDFMIFPNFQGGVSGEAAMEIFNEARVPVGVVDVWHPNSIFFGADNYTSGAIAGIETGKYASEQWNCENVWILLGENPPEGEAADLRMVGFRDGIRTECSVPDSQVDRINLDGTADQAITATTDWLTAHPQADHVLCGTIDDERASGMARALTASVRDGVCAGQGGDLPGTSLLREGSAEETHFVGTVGYFPERYGKWLVAIAIDILEGRAVPQEVHIEHLWIDGDNLDEFYDEEGNAIGLDEFYSR